MIGKQVTVTYDYVVDEATKIAIFDGEFVKFDTSVDENGAEVIADTFAPIDACAVADEYLAKNIRIPDEFAPARECIQSRIAALQAVL